MKPTGYILFLLFTPLVLLSQYSVDGTVKDDNNIALPFSNVFLLKAIDSTLVKGSSANEEGYFQIKNIKKGQYLIKASYFNSESKIIPLHIQNDSTVDNLVVQKTTEELEEVVVVSKRPTIERKADRVVFNVENTSVSQSSSWDILKSTPGVINAQNGLLIRGKSATIYLNNRKIQLSEEEAQTFLEGLSGTNIKSIEVIHNPPASFDAEGGAVLNITTSKNLIPGYKGSINASYAQSVFAKYSLGTSHYFKTDKLSIFANYNIKPKKVLKIIDSDIEYIDTSIAVFSIWEIDFENTTTSAAQNANIILDYDFNKSNSLNFTSFLSTSPNKTKNNNVITDIQNGLGQLDSLFTTNGTINQDNFNLGIDATYKHQFKKEGSELTGNLHFTRFIDEGEQSVNSLYTDPLGNSLRNVNFSTASNQDIDIYTGQLDFVSPMHKLYFKTGIKASQIISKNTYDFFDVNTTGAVQNTSLSDNFEYNEQVYAGYISVLRNWEKWVLKTGLRGEQTYVEGNSLVLNTSNVQNYFELFPSFYLLHNVSDKSSFSFDYSRKLDRPDYQDLNPFRVFLNENDFNEGNPNLIPNFSHNFNVNYTLNSTYFFDFYYRDNGEYISSLSFQDNENQTLRQINQNVSGSISYGLDFTVSSPISDAWYLYAYTSLFSESETFLAVESDNAIVKNKVEGYYLSLNNYITLSKDGTFNGEVSLDYLSTFIGGSYVQTNPSTTLNLSLKKTLWNNKVSLSLRAEDILGKANPRYRSRYLNQNNSYLSVEETQFVRFGFRYNFGNFRLSDTDKELDKKERDRLKSE